MRWLGTVIVNSEILALDSGKFDLHHTKVGQSFLNSIFMNKLSKRMSLFACRQALTAVALVMVLSASADAGDSAAVAANAVYLQPLPGLSVEERKVFDAGEKVFRTAWLVFPSMPIANWEYVRPPPMTAWGLGPTFIANSCMACHVQGGHGKTPEQPGQTVFQQLLRISLPGEDAQGRPRRHPMYGDQIQVFDTIAANRKHIKQGEADVLVDWLPEPVMLPDGTRVELRKPRIRVEQLAFGPLGDDVMMSLRNARAVFGLGYLEAISEADILALAALQKTQGLNGRPNTVRDDVTGTVALGRFGWKANQPSVRQQIAAAFLGDMGVTSTLYPRQNCPAAQEDCRAMPPGDKAELRQADFDLITLWVLALDAPAVRDPSRADIQRGANLFRQAACAHCHVPEMKTGKFAALPALSERTVRAYTDLLLHDMGPGLADGRPDFKAGPRDWRTSPLWGIGLSKQVNGSTDLLHDGRARNVLEAILWHGGEAQRSRDAFAALPAADREALIAFVNSL